LVFFSYEVFVLFAPCGRELFCAGFCGIPSADVVFSYKIAMLALVSKIGMMNPAITDGLAPLRTD
jgi:hypothetical protein